jgi:gliding motility associated protien GldN
MITLLSRWAAPFMLAFTFAIVADNCQAQEIDTPLDGITPRTLIKERQVLEYDFIHEKDVMWEKRIWRVINIDEKRNHIFRNEKMPFINILLRAARSGEITVYNTGNDEFKDPMSKKDACALGVTFDTVEVFDPITYKTTYVPVVNEFDPTSVKKFRVKEVFFFDEETSTMGVRILGIAPIVKRLDDLGNVLFEGPMFWAYYPQLREVLSREVAFNEANDASNLSWEDVFESRMFASYVTKESNIHDRRIQDYLAGTNAVIEGQNIEKAIQNFEGDLWEY